MAKKSTRLLSLLLSVLMLVSMVSVVATAEYVYDGNVDKVPDYYSVDYDSLVGVTNQNATGVYVVNANWKVDESTNTVSFYFRGQTVTENYDPNRHLASVADVYTKASASMVSMPTVILTAGNYSEKINLTGSIILLGAQAGINPNIPNSDPSKPWGLSRPIPALASYDAGNETRFWTPGSEDFYAQYASSGAQTDKNLHLIEIAQTTGKTCKYVLDGLMFQGYGAVVNDTTGGSGTHEIYAQNCVFNDGYAYDTDQFRTWNRGPAAACFKKLFVSNCYATGFKHLGFYSGHSSDIRVNGFCYQDNYATGFYKVKTLQWQGLNFEMYNSHFYNSPEVATAKKSSNNCAYDNKIFYFANDGVSNKEAGTNNEKYRYTFCNNSFTNCEKIQEGKLYAPDSGEIIIAMGGTNELLTMEDNIFINTLLDEEPEKASVLRILYQVDKTTGLPSHAFTADNQQKISGTAAYELNSSNLSIKNNTFCGKIYQTGIDIGTNTHPDTLVETTGNVYLDSYGSTVGKVIPGTAQNHDKWVWLDISDKTDPTNRSDYIHTGDISVSGDNLVADSDNNKNLTTTVDSTTESYTITASCNTDYGNSIKYYKADADFNKLEECTAEVSTDARENYYVVSVLSMDGWTSEDYHITIKRSPRPGAVLNGIVDEAAKTLTQDKTVDYCNYEVDYLNKVFTFTLDVPTGATTALTAGETAIAPVEGNTYALPLDELETVYNYGVTVTDTAGKSETYALSLLRRPNHRTELEQVLVADSSVTVSDPVDYVWNTDVSADTSTLKFSFAISENATIVVRDPVYNAPVVASDGVYTANDLAVGTNKYSITVTAQNGVDQQTWYLAINRSANTDHELLGIKNATKTAEGEYTANVKQNYFMISPSYSYGATAHVYANEACTEEITDFYLTLTKKTTVVWIKIVAEDGVSSSVTKLTINTTANVSGGSDTPVMVNDGIIGVLGADFVGDGQVLVLLPAGTKEFDFKIVGYNGYTVKVFGDSALRLLTVNEMKLNLDSAATQLYAVATKDDDAQLYTIMIVSERPYQFTDKQVAWAEGYVEALSTSGLGIMYGDEHGAFNGENKLTRYEMAVMLIRMSGINHALYANVKVPFEDAIVDWAADYVKAAYRVGLIGGYSVTDTDGNVLGYVYKGDNNATRSEFLRVLMNALVGDVDEFYKDNKADIDAEVAALHFSDLDDVDEWAVSAVYSAVYTEVIKGDGDRLNPDGEITRNEVAVILCRLLFGME